MRSVARAPARSAWERFCGKRWEVSRDRLSNLLPDPAVVPPEAPEPAPDCSRTQTGLSHGAQMGPAGELSTGSFTQASQQARSFQKRHHSVVGTTRLFGSAGFPATQGTGVSGTHLDS